jgi:hypothetical protein
MKNVLKTCKLENYYTLSITLDICERYTSTQNQIYFGILVQSRVSMTLHFVSSTNKMKCIPKDFILFY